MSLGFSWQAERGGNQCLQQAIRFIGSLRDIFAVMNSMRLPLFIVRFIWFVPFVCAAATSSGTGFFITSSGYVATNFHVVDGATSLSVQNIRGQTFSAKLIRSDEANDLAILKIDGKFPALPLARSSTVRRGDSVFTLGFPNTRLQGLSVKLTDGVVSSLSGIRDEPNNFQISVPIQPGNSGGPLINREGAVVGVVVAKLSAAAALKSGSSIPEVVNYAVKSNYLLELIDTDMNLSEQVRVAARTGKDVSLANLAAKAEPSVLLVIATKDEREKPLSTSGIAPPRPSPTPSPPPMYVPDAGEEADVETGLSEVRQGNHSRALLLFKKPAERGNAQAQNALGIMYQRGLGLPVDYLEAARWYRKAANQGFASAQVNLGAMYDKGLGIEKDYAEAVRWFRRAADQGDPNGQYNLGLYYAKGQGVVRDDVEAVVLFRRAAEQGHAMGQYVLGLIFAEGLGIPKDDAEAIQWFRKAADQGHPQAKEELKRRGLI